MQSLDRIAGETPQISVVEASLLAAAVLRPELAYRLAGVAPLGEPSVEDLDTLSGSEDRQAQIFFGDRNQVEVTVPRTMTVDEFLALYLIDQPHIRQEIAAQEGKPEVRDETILQEGKTYTLSLTPPELMD